MTHSVPVTVVVITKNEQANVQSCLKSLPSHWDVTVVDDFSEDRTVELVEKLGARVIQHRFESFAAQRNWALDHADLPQDWILFLDADEHATTDFIADLSGQIASAGDDVAAFRICRQTMLWEKWLRRSDGFPVWIMRVVRRGRARFLDSGHGEVPVPPVDGTVGTVRKPIVHYPFSKGMDDWFARLNRYSSNEARLEIEECPEFHCGDLFTTDRAKRRRAIRNLGRRLPGRAVLRFVYQYIWRWGFLDGRAGLTFCLSMAIYEAMIVVKRQELRTDGKERRSQS